MNQHDPSAKSTGPKSAQDHFAKCPWCAEEMAEDRELVEMIQQSLWDSLAHQSPPPEVWDRIRARLPERQRAGRGEHTFWTWPRLLPSAIVVGLLIAFVSLVVWQSVWPGKRGVGLLPATPRTGSHQVGWRGIDKRELALPQEDERPIAIAALPGGVSTFDAMTSEGLLNVGYLNRLQRLPRLEWKEPHGSRSAVTDANDPRNPLP